MRVLSKFFHRSVLVFCLHNIFRVFLTLCLDLLNKLCRLQTSEVLDTFSVPLQGARFPSGHQIYRTGIKTLHIDHWSITGSHPSSEDAPYAQRINFGRFPCLRKFGLFASEIFSVPQISSK